MAANPRARTDAPFIVRPYGVALSLFVLFYAAYHGASGVALLAGGAVMLAGLGWLCASLSVWRVCLARTLSADCGFPGEQIVLATTVENKKPLPAPWLEIQYALPDGLSVQGASSTFSHLFHLLWYRRLTWTTQLALKRRGVYRLDAVVPRGGDPFGLVAKEGAAADSAEILVYPRLLPLERVAVLARAVFGRQVPPRSLFEDPSRMAGLRDYGPGDPMNRIDWKATARQQRLQVRTYQPTTTPEVLVVLALDGQSGLEEGVTCDTAEHAISVAASLAHYGVEAGWSVGLLTGGEPSVVLMPAASRQQTIGALRGLARLDPTGPTAWDDVLALRRRDIPGGTTLLFVCCSVCERVTRAAHTMAGKGRPVAFVVAGEVAGDEMGSFGEWPVLCVPMMEA